MVALPDTGALGALKRVFVVETPAEKERRINKETYDKVLKVLDESGLDPMGAAAVALMVATGVMAVVPGISERRGSVINALTSDLRVRLQRYLPRSSADEQAVRGDSAPPSVAPDALVSAT